MKTCNGAALFPDTEMMSRTEGYKSNEGEEGGRAGGGFEVGEEVAGPCRLLPKPAEVGPIDSKRVCSTLKSRSLLPFLSLLPSTLPPVSFHRHCSLAFHLPSVADRHPLPTLYLSFSLVRSFVRSFVLDVNDAMGGHGPANPKSPFPRYKALPLFSASSFRGARLRANTFCEQTSQHKYRATGEIDLLYFKDPANTRKSNVSNLPSRLFDRLSQSNLTTMAVTIVINFV